MYTYIEIKEFSCSTICYVSLEIKKEELVLKKAKGFYWQTACKINLKEIEYLSFTEEMGVQQIFFVHKDVLYKFFECGLAVMEWLKKKL